MAYFSNTFSVCVSDRWQLAFGDPGVMGWAVFAAFALAAAGAVMVLRAAAFEAPHRRQLQVLWAMIAIMMAVLALNKQLDLQSLMIALGRCLAQEQGWYENRRLVQRDFVLGLIALAALTGAGLFWVLHGILRQSALPLLGLAALAGFVLIRAGHLFHIFVPEDVALDYLVHHLTSLLEVICPVLILAAAWRILRPLHARSNP